VEEALSFVGECYFTVTDIWCWNLDPSNGYTVSEVYH
jgi:hypothetical protein